MNTTFSCPKCEQQLVIDSSASGSVVSCPSCSQSLVVPTAPRPIASVKVAASVNMPRSAQNTSEKPGKLMAIGIMRLAAGGINILIAVYFLATLADLFSAVHRTNQALAPTNQALTQFYSQIAPQYRNPGSVTIGYDTLVNFHNIALLIGAAYLSLLGGLEINNGVKIVSNPIRIITIPKNIAIMEILAVLTFNGLSLAVGIVNLVLGNDKEVTDYLATVRGY